MLKNSCLSLQYSHVVLLVDVVWNRKIKYLQTLTPLTVKQVDGYEITPSSYDTLLSVDTQNFTVYDDTPSDTSYEICDSLFI